MAVALGRVIALQLEAVGSLAPQARQGILAGKVQGIHHCSVLKPIDLVNNLFINR